MNEVITPVMASLKPRCERRDARKASAATRETQYSNAASNEYALRERLYSFEIYISVGVFIVVKFLSKGVEIIITHKSLFVNLY